LKHPSQVLQGLGLKARKSFGQNFLTSQSSLQGFEKIISPHTNILEIGPGLGSITEWLTQQNYTVKVIEKDRLLAKYLTEAFTSVKVIEKDALQVELADINDCSFAIGNLPFQITAPCMQKTILSWSNLKGALWGLQYEVARKLASHKGNSLALLLQSTGTVRFIRKISRNSFFPVPAVDGGWVYWERNLKTRANANLIEILLRGLFWGKRKKILTIVQKNPHWCKHPDSLEWQDRYLSAPKVFRGKYDSVRPDTLDVTDIHNFMSQFTA
jgi:16S rRNA (adenine1518-N6/adenine1519-N6)-dimethyltransferase